MSALLLLGLCLVLGVLAARFATLPANLPPCLNWWVLNIALPSLVLVLVPKLAFDPHLWFLVVTQWAVFAGAWLLFAAIGKARHWPRGRTGALILVCGLGNTSFMGYPMIEALRGQEGLKLAVVADQVGCFTILAVGGIVVAALYSGRQPKLADVVKRVAYFPPFLAFIVAAIIGALGGWPTAIDTVLAKLGATLTPLALFSVGLQFKLHLQRSQLGALAIGLSWKLLVAPLLVYTTGRALHITPDILTIATLQCAMAPMISAAILADQNNLEPRLANTVLGAGIVLSLGTVLAANYLLG
jgi:predicted permease